MQRQYERTHNFEKKQEYVCRSKPCSCLVCKTNDAVTDHLETSLRPNRCQPAAFSHPPPPRSQCRILLANRILQRACLFQYRSSPPRSCASSTHRAAVPSTLHPPIAQNCRKLGRAISVTRWIWTSWIRGLIGDEAPSRCEECCHMGLQV